MAPADAPDGRPVPLLLRFRTAMCASATAAANVASSGGFRPSKLSTMSTSDSLSGMDGRLELAFGLEFFRTMVPMLPLGAPSLVGLSTVEEVLPPGAVGGSPFRPLLADGGEATLGGLPALAAAEEAVASDMLLARPRCCWWAGRSGVSGDLTSALPRWSGVGGRLDAPMSTSSVAGPAAVASGAVADVAAEVDPLERERGRGSTTDDGREDDATDERVSTDAAATGVPISVGVAWYSAAAVSADVQRGEVRPALLAAGVGVGG